MSLYVELCGQLMVNAVFGSWYSNFINEVNLTVVTLSDVYYRVYRILWLTRDRDQTIMKSYRSQGSNSSIEIWELAKQSHNFMSQNLIFPVHTEIHNLCNKFWHRISRHFISPLLPSPFPFCWCCWCRTRHISVLCDSHQLSPSPQRIFNAL